MLKIIKVAVLGVFFVSGAAWSNNLQVAEAARKQIGKTIQYDPRYVKLAYPMGDVLEVAGVCSDVVIRALRVNQVDLQVLVHEDMSQHFNQYPNSWGLIRTDKNIDHRRVPNLEVFFKRQGKSLPVTLDGKSYHAGDIISWRLDNGLPHIGIVSMNKVANTKRPLVIHNIGAGVREEDVLFEWKMIGHYRYYKN
ncbi:DUF1287 domain-containing protein [Entomomonas moraniae]|uniref:DUF1287 domain-containing protein n=1 Tax=Entomomonas moraniae TaxID=2213226 RepID=UPI001E5865A6|nr:DUF1287 domain-containing protein [Entomomonas moraniae]